MNLLRFVSKCVLDPPAAAKSARLVWRSVYGRWYWARYPREPLVYRLPTGGSLYLEPDNSFTTCFWPAAEDYEPEVCCLLRQTLRPGDVFVDCGANVGYFSVMAAGLVGRRGEVLAIEANPSSFSLLQRNLAALPQCRAVHAAITTKQGDVELHVPQEGDIYSTLCQNRFFAPSGVKTTRVPSRPLDAIFEASALPSPRVLKIDVEGAEMDVLASGAKLVANHRPLISIEYGEATWSAFGKNHRDLQTWISANGYRMAVLDAISGALEPMKGTWWSSLYCNIVLFPEDTCGPEIVAKTHNV